MTDFRNATRDELGTILDWAAAEGWNPGLDDAETFFSSDPGGFFVACENDTPVAAISVVNHDEAFAFLGLYIVTPDFRGRGIGYGLWQHALAHAGTRTVGLDGVPDQQQNYATSGFIHAGATTRYAGSLTPLPDPAIRLSRDDEMPGLIAAEAQASGSLKPAYLSAWFRNSPTRKTLVLEKAGHPVGLCTIRQCQQGAKIGPLIAASAGDAERLMRHAVTLFAGEIMIDVPDAAPELAELCQSFDMVPGFETARMYRGTFFSGTPRLFAVTSLELG